MVPDTVMAEDADCEALLKISGPLPAVMQELVREFIKRLQVVADDHAAAVAKLDAQADALRVETEVVKAKNAELETTIDALNDQNHTLEREVSLLRDMYDALIAERAALEAVETAVAHHAERKRHVDALLKTAGSNAHQRPVSCAPVNAVADGGNAVADLDGNAGDPSSAPPVANSTAAGRGECADAPGEIAASNSNAGGAAGGRRNAGSPHISS
jgi:prefoldin subunit 5